MMPPASNTHFTAPALVSILVVVVVEVGVVVVVVVTDELCTYTDRTTSLIGATK